MPLAMARDSLLCRIRITIFAVVACFQATLAQAAPPHSQTLDTGWRFQLDPLRVGDAQHWENVATDRSGWRVVEVPMAWDFHDPVMDGYEGVGWYALDLPADRLVEGAWQRLRFNRANYHAIVWVNGQKAGENLNGYVPFEVPISPLVTPGQPASVVVRVENGVRYDWLPGTTTVEWVQYGGLLEPVDLLTTAPVHIAHVSIRATPEGDGADVRAIVEIANKSPDSFAGRVLVESDAYEAHAEFTVNSDSIIELPLEFQMSEARPWSPDAPSLYDLRVRLFDAHGEIDAITHRFGVRSIETKGTQILLNGQPIRIRGVNRYDEFRSRGPVVDESTIRSDLKAVKASGANLIRVHYPQAPAHLRVADELGLLFIEEVPLNWWRASWHPPVPPEFENDRIIDAAESTLQQMVRRDGNHPSLIVWSVANECEATDELGVRAMERLLTRAKSLDPSRLATYAANRNFPKNRAMAHADLVSVNLYYGMWDGLEARNLGDIEDRVFVPTRDALAEIATLFSNKPILVTEFGTIGIPGSGGDFRFSEDFQAAYVTAVWRAIEQVPAVTGGIVWAWADYRHRNGFTNDFPTEFGPFGLVTLDRRPKKAHAELSGLWLKPRSDSVDRRGGTRRPRQQSN